MRIDFMEDIWRTPALLLQTTLVDVLLCAVPVSVALLIGLVIGWSRRPQWSSGLVFLGLRSKVRFLWTAPPGFGAHRLWFAFTAFSLGRRIWFVFKGKREAESDRPRLVRNDSGESLSMEASMGQHDIVTEEDLDHFLHLLEGKVGDVEWQKMMEHSIPNMAYQAWRLEPETGPAVYRTKTVYEDVSPELVRDFFWDDEFRPKWDPMLAHVEILDECQHTGMLIAHWIKKFPFFCSDREYIFGRRIWESGRTFYCVTKGVPYPGLPKRDKPRRVELYFSSWIIKPVQSRKGDGQLSACEVTLVHYEDMGIPKDVAKLGVRHGMWGAVKRTHSGMRAYQVTRKCEGSLSISAQMAQITTKIHINNNNNSEETLSEVELQGQQGPENQGQQGLEIQGQQDLEHRVDKGVDWRWVVVGGSVALVCGLHTGLIGKVLLFGAARKLAKR